MFDTKSYDSGLSSDIYEYESVVWTNHKRSIPSVIPILAVPMFCETIIHSK
jgi:hypothetical protein